MALLHIAPNVIPVTAMLVRQGTATAHLIFGFGQYQKNVACNIKFNNFACRFNILFHSSDIGPLRLPRRGEFGGLYLPHPSLPIMGGLKAGYCLIYGPT